MTHGRIFNRAGDLVAVVTQEGLTRHLPPGVERCHAPASKSKPGRI